MDNDFKRPLGNNTSGVSAPTQAAKNGGYGDAPETYVTADGEPTTPTKQPSGNTRLSRVLRFIKWLFAVLAVLGLVGAAGWFWYDGQNAKSDLRSTKAQLQEATVTASRFKAAADETSKKQNSTVPETNIQRASGAVVSYVHAMKASEESTVTLDTSKFDETKDFSWIAYTTKTPDGGAKCIVKKVTLPADTEVVAAWVVVFCGQSVPDKTTADTFGIPANI